MASKVHPALAWVICAPCAANNELKSHRHAQIQINRFLLLMIPAGMIISQPSHDPQRHKLKLLLIPCCPVVCCRPDNTSCKWQGCAGVQTAVFGSRSRTDRLCSSILLHMFAVSYCQAVVFHPFPWCQAFHVVS